MAGALAVARIPLLLRPLACGLIPCTLAVTLDQEAGVSCRSSAVRLAWSTLCVYEHFGLQIMQSALCCIIIVSTQHFATG